MIRSKARLRESTRTVVSSKRYDHQFCSHRSQTAKLTPIMGWLASRNRGDEPNKHCVTHVPCSANSWPPALGCKRRSMFYI